MLPKRRDKSRIRNNPRHCGLDPQFPNGITMAGLRALRYQTAGNDAANIRHIKVASDIRTSISVSISSIFYDQSNQKSEINKKTLQLSDIVGPVLPLSPFVFRLLRRKRDLFLSIYHLIIKHL